MKYSRVVLLAIAGCSEVTDEDALGSSDEGAVASRSIPCDVQEVLDRQCTTCHGEMPRYGAPMSLWGAGDWRVPAVGDPTHSVYEQAIVRIDDAARPMPPTMPMPADDDAILRAWLAAGAPADATASCGNTAMPEDPVGPDALPCEPTLTITAHADGSSEGFAVPAEGVPDTFVCFTFKSELAAQTQATAWAPIIDDDRVLHHWILFRTSTPQPDGAVGPCTYPADLQPITGWAPGGLNFEMPADVGLDLGGPDDSFILQMHYNNAAHHEDVADRSGVALCTVDEPRPQTAGVFTLGSVAIDIPAGASDFDVTSVCSGFATLLLREPLNVISTAGHMHKLGRAIKTELVHREQKTTVLDVPNFSFDSQALHPLDPPLRIERGDSLTTTCTYDNPGSTPVSFGEGTADEMCFNFLLAYPIEAMPIPYCVGL
jgi:copper type II ascorbate-dependent monooxygenase-like protein